MVAVAQFLEIEPCFGQIETAVWNWVLRCGWNGFVYDENRGENDEVDNRRHNGHCNWDERERVVASHGRCCSWQRARRQAIKVVG